MNKFKDGDKVKIIKNRFSDEVYNKYIGDICKIIECNNSLGKYIIKLRDMSNITYWCEDELELVQEDKPLTLKDIKVGMKVIPIKKTYCGHDSFEDWKDRGSSVPEYFKTNKYLYVVNIDSSRIMLGIDKSEKTGDFFRSSDLKLYIEEPKSKSINKISETITYEYQPCNVTVKAESVNSTYDGVCVLNLPIEKETIKFIFNGDITICILQDGTKGITTCNPDDIYDMDTGKDIAFYRAKIKRMENEIKQLSKQK